ncbi:alpha-methylacyl-CoA racemase-like [Ctenocephalides felis]|uniref:alpha-methylacyl-CoA racemase-like n=1 Tax=Ctenocephalides felis TaxID=7515 RepID=UPI000E6E1435|nr:alpha-methylacyl-CoA racemase-like [Ctenocephalides felis]
MPLQGIKVLEFAGLAPAPFCGMILKEFGASVTRIDKVGQTHTIDVLGNGKSSIAMDLKHTKSVDIVKKLCKVSDVLIEPFRPGVMEKLGLGPNILLAENPRLIYARLTGFGQKGPYSLRAGHDINYIAISGVLSLLGRYNEKPTFPINLIADFAGGGLLCAFGIALALLERFKSNKGQVIDSNMVEGAAYVASWITRSQHLPIWGNERGKNILDTGSHFYDTYKTKDNKYMAVGAIEPQFYVKFIEGLGLSVNDVPQFSNMEESKKIISDKFLQKTQEEWCEIFENVDACVTPVLTMSEAPDNKHNKERESFISSTEYNHKIPKPAPFLYRTPGMTRANLSNTLPGKDTITILQKLNYNKQEIDDLISSGVVEQSKMSKL